MGQASPSSVTVIYVDDEPDYADLVADQLATGEAGLEVLTYTDAREAFDRLGSNDVDCVVSDYEMPEMDGLEFLEAVREEYPDLPFILFTGRGSEDIASEAISAGVTEYMQKETDPRQFDVLANRVHNAVEKHRTERELERTETRYRRLVEQNLTGIYIIQDGDIEYANPKCAEIFGYDQAELLERSIFDVVAEEDHDLLREHIEACQAGETEEYSCTLTGLRKGGERFEFEVHSGRIDHEGEPAILGTLIDVTEQVERERELEEYRELVENVGDPMYVLDAEGKIQKINEAMAGTFGYDREELIGTHAQTFLSEGDLEAGRDLIQEFIEGERESPQTREFRFRTADGEVIPCEVNLSILTDEAGEFRGSVGVVRVIAERKERERELEEYETIVETAPDGIFILDEDGYFRRSNETGARLVGYDREELIGEHYSRLVEEDIVDATVFERYDEIVGELRSADSDRQKAKFEATVRPHDGSRFICEIHLALLPSGGGFRGTVGVIRDITERKVIEDALRAERDRLSALFENIPEPTVDYEFRDGRPHIVRVNDAFEEVFGYDEAAVLGEPLDEYIVPEDRDDQAKHFNEWVEGGGTLDIEIKRRTADGDLRDFLLRNAPIPTDDGTAQGYAIYTDITERKERERRLSALHEATRELMEATSREEVTRIGIEAAESVLGLEVASFYSRQDGRSILEPIEATDGARELFGELPTIPEAGGLAWQVFESGEPIIADDIREYEGIYNPDTPVRSEMILPVGEDGVFMAASTEVGGFDELDRSLAKVLVSNVESALDRAHRETLLREREQALLRQNERLEEFAGVVSHDLRSPLTVAKGNVYLLRQSDNEKYLRKVENALERMERLIDDLLTLARQGETVNEPERVDTSGLIKEAWETVETGAATLEVEAAPAVEADRGRLQELLENLFRNAIEHNDEDVTVRVGVLDDRRGIYVEDDGEGIDEEVRNELFEAGTTTAEKGTGFGLSIVKQIVEAHGWQIDVTESAEGGARFEISNMSIRGLEPQP